jgi:hypothetical protein
MTSRQKSQRQRVGICIAAGAQERLQDERGWRRKRFFSFGDPFAAWKM